MSMSIIYCILVFLITFKVFNYFRVSNQTLRIKYELERLKDKLYWLSINGNIKKDDEMFIYLDNALSKSSKHIDRLNFWVILYIMVSSKNVTVIRQQHEIEIGLSKSEELRNIFKEFSGISMNYLLSKSRFSLFIVLFCSFMFKLIASSFNLNRIFSSYRKKEQRFKSVMIMTETNNPYCF